MRQIHPAALTNSVDVTCFHHTTQNRDFFGRIRMNNITQPVLPGLQPGGSGPVVLTADGVPAGSLSPQEAVLYPSLFKLALGPKAMLTETTIPASTAANFLKRSGLNKKQLHDVWSFSDPSDLGYLTAEGFYKACRLVAHIQCGANPVTSDLISLEPQSLPYFEGVDGGVDGLWKISDSELKTFTELYTKEGGTNKLDGTDARAILMRSGLSNSELCDIWDLADTDCDGKLTFGEFLTAMVIVSRVRDGKAFIPPQLPGPLKDILDMRPGETVTHQVFAANVPVEEKQEKTSGFGGQTSTSPPIVREMSSSVKFVPSSPRGNAEPTLIDPPQTVDNKELSQSFRRGREFRKQALEGRARLASLREEAKKAEIELLSVDKEAERIGDQILSLKQQITEAEEELEAFRREAGQAYITPGGTNKDVVTAVAAIRQSITEDEREILELRAQVERVNREKIDLQSTYNVLQEKKRQSDQDRNLMLIGLENERAKLVAVRAERLKLWEQRHQLTRELTTKTFEQLNPKALNSGLILPSTAALESPQRQVRDRKGIKADSPNAVSGESKLDSWSKFG
jgi:hypothetical protein